jgi:hypothetical protein
MVQRRLAAYAAEGQKAEIIEKESIFQLIRETGFVGH